MMPTINNQFKSVRSAYARQVLALEGVLGNQQLEKAFATVPREMFLGQDKWQIMTSSSGYTKLPKNDPTLIYQDVVVGLDTHRGINNGSPSLHARWMNAMAPQLGDTVAHIGAGSGYYSAILAELVGKQGKVVAVEYDKALAEQLSENLSYASNIETIFGDGAIYPDIPVDCIYVNFGVARPAERWIENLKIDGRLVLPLGVPDTHEILPGRYTAQAIGLMVKRLKNGYAASSLGVASFICAEGQLRVSGQEVEKLRSSLRNGNDDQIRSLMWKCKQNSERLTWLTASDWALTFEGPIPK